MRRSAPKTSEITWSLAVFALATAIGTLTIRVAPGADNSVASARLQAAPVESMDDPLSAIFQILGTSPTGKETLSSAVQHWGLKDVAELPKFIRWGQVSRTDAILTRRLDSSTGLETRTREVIVYLKRDQDTVSAAMDLAHELTHAVEGPVWDPYDANLSPGRYIVTAIEGRGGEVEALMRECQVALELNVPARCQRYLEAGQVNRKRVVSDFYRVGDWHGDISRKIGNENRLMPELSGQRPELYSSTGSAPYPVALYREYEDMRATACENTRKRMAQRRDPASENFMVRRCSSTVTESRATRVPAGSAPVSAH